VKSVNLTDYIFDDVEIKYQSASDLIKARILDDSPLLVSRLGTELFAMLNYKEVKLSRTSRMINFIRGNIYYDEWNDTIINLLSSHTGVFPANIETAEAFSDILLSDLKIV